MIESTFCKTEKMKGTNTPFNSGPNNKKNRNSLRLRWLDSKLINSNWRRRRNLWRRRSSRNRKLLSLSWSLITLFQSRIKFC